jgi:hypothetical protein
MPNTVSLFSLIFAANLVRLLTVSETVGARAVMVHAIDEEAAGFYRKFGFLTFPTNSSLSVFRWRRRR